MIWVAAAFLVTALLYASVGFGGGSTYSALLALTGFDYRLLPILSLACNIVVVAGSSIRFGRAGVTPWKGALLLTGLAAPAALLGGLTPVREDAFFLVLGTSLILAGVFLFCLGAMPKGARRRRRVMYLWPRYPWATCRD